MVIGNKIKWKDRLGQKNDMKGKMKGKEGHKDRRK